MYLLAYIYFIFFVLNDQNTPFKLLDKQYRLSAFIILAVGVVKFDINYTVSGPDISSVQEFTNVGDISKESDVLDVIWEDGQKLDISVKASDIVGQHIVDTITIYKDSTAPEVENLWLTRNDKDELFVHHIEDFTKMTLVYFFLNFFSM